MKDILKEIFIELHQFPELSFQEFKTTQKIKDTLTHWQIPFNTFGLETGLCASFGPDKGPHIMLRCDIDALPITEEADVSYPSCNIGIMHACGHDYHTTSMLGTCYILKQEEHQLTHKVTCLFQPGEEATTGAIKVIEAGALEGVDRIYGMHVSHDLPLGCVSLTKGPNYAAPDIFDIIVTGIGSHGAYPHKGRNPIYAASAIVQGLANINSNQISTFDPSIISVTNFHSGTAWNVIEPKAVLKGTIRTFKEETRSQIIASMTDLVENLSKAYGCKASLTITGGHPATYNTPELVDRLANICQDLKTPTQVAPPVMAGEDFAYYQKLVPGCFFNFGMGEGEDLHHPAFKVDPDLLPISARLMAELGKRG